MTEENRKIQEAIAAANGYSNFRIKEVKEGEGVFAYSYEVLYGDSPQFKDVEVPDYLNCHDAMNEAISALKDFERGRFWEELHQIVHGFCFWGRDTTNDDCFAVMMATLPQKIEAYLKVKGLWQE